MLNVCDYPLSLLFFYGWKIFPEVTNEREEKIMLNKNRQRVIFTITLCKNNSCWHLKLDIFIKIDIYTFF